MEPAHPPRAEQPEDRQQELIRQAIPSEETADQVQALVPAQQQVEVREEHQAEAQILSAIPSEILLQIPSQEELEAQVVIPFQEELEVQVVQTPLAAQILLQEQAVQELEAQAVIPLAVLIPSQEQQAQVRAVPEQVMQLVWAQAHPA